MRIEKIDWNDEQHDQPEDWKQSYESLNGVGSPAGWLVEVLVMHLQNDEPTQDKKEIHTAVAERENVTEKCVVVFFLA